jgi:hypothetical protein
MLSFGIKYALNRGKAGTGEIEPHPTQACEVSSIFFKKRDNDCALEKLKPAIAHYLDHGDLMSGARPLVFKFL